MFKRGVTYKRDEIAAIARPEDPPHGGAWTTGYARIESDLFIFMNIGVPGRKQRRFGRLPGRIEIDVSLQTSLKK